MDTYSFIVGIETDYICKEITEDVETRFDTANYELNRWYSEENNKNVIGLTKDELGRKIRKTIVGL